MPGGRLDGNDCFGPLVGLGHFDAITAFGLGLPRIAAFHAERKG
jgi:hypothetical protein